MDWISLELENLIKKTTAEAVHRLMVQPEKSIDGGPAVNRRKMLVLVPGLVGKPQESVDYIRNNFQDYEVTCMLFESMGLKSYLRENCLVNEASILNYKESTSRERLVDSIDSYDAVCCISPGLKQMEAISQGDDSGFFEKLFIFFILHGKPAGVLLDYGLNSPKPSALSKRLETLTASLKDMGVTVSALQTQADKTEDSSLDCMDLISQNDIEDIWKNGVTEVNCRKGCIITPLAKDRANELGMRIVWQEG